MTLLKRYLWTYAGRRVYLDPLNASSGSWSRDDVVNSLARINRWTGHTHPNLPGYSVAQHSVVVSHLATYFGASREKRRLYGCMGLAHDMHEFVLNDISSQVKAELGSERLRQLADDWDQVLGVEFGIPIRHSVIIKHCDRVAQRLEARYLMNITGEAWRSFCDETPGWENYRDLYQRDDTEDALPTVARHMLFPLGAVAAAAAFRVRMKELGMI